MSSKRMGLDLILRAANRLSDAKRALRGKRFADTIRYSQECTELGIKGVLRLIGVEYPKSHDVGNVLANYEQRLPDWSQEEIEKISSISQELFSLRGMAMYGDEVAGIPAGDLFDRDDAIEAIQSAEYVYAMIERIVTETK